jgi:hypothetical protein
LGFRSAGAFFLATEFAAHTSAASCPADVDCPDEMKLIGPLNREGLSFLGEGLGEGLAPLANLFS